MKEEVSPELRMHTAKIVVEMFAIIRTNQEEQKKKAVAK